MKKHLPRILIPLSWVLLTASYPVTTGTEVSVRGGAGIMQWKDSTHGCGPKGSWRNEDRYQMGALSIRHRPANTDFYVAGEVAVGKADTVKTEAFVSEAGASPVRLSNRFSGQGYAVAGIQKEHVGYEVGLGLAGAPYFIREKTLPIPYPAGAIRLQSRGFFTYASLFEGITALDPIGQVGVGYTSKFGRFRLAYPGTFEGEAFVQNIGFGIGGSLPLGMDDQDEGLRRSGWLRITYRFETDR